MSFSSTKVHVNGRKKLWPCSYFNTCNARNEWRLQRQTAFWCGQLVSMRTHCLLMSCTHNFIAFSILTKHLPHCSCSSGTKTHNRETITFLSSPQLHILKFHPCLQSTQLKRKFVSHQVSFHSSLRGRLLPFSVGIFQVVALIPLNSRGSIEARNIGTQYHNVWQSS